MPEFIAIFLITVVLFHGGKALSDFLTALPKVLTTALYGIDEPTIDSFIPALIVLSAAFFNLYFCCHSLSFGIFVILCLLNFLNFLTLYKLSSVAFNSSLHFFCLSALVKGILFSAKRQYLISI